LFAGEQRELVTFVLFDRRKEMRSDPLEQNCSYPISWWDMSCAGLLIIRNMGKPPVRIKRMTRVAARRRKMILRTLQQYIES
jgi:hypothetical protein